MPCDYLNKCVSLNVRTKTSDTDRLIAGLRRRDSQCQREAITRYGRLVTSIVGAMAFDPRDTEELTQDTFIRAFAAIDSFNPQVSQLSTWLGRIAYHTAVDYLRRRGARPTEELSAEPPEPPATDADTDDTMLPELLYQALELIAPGERTALQLVYFDKLTLEEAAYVLDTNANALSTRLYRIRNKLARIINELKNKQ